jgi:hypothetical protein
MFTAQNLYATIVSSQRLSEWLLASSKRKTISPAVFLARSGCRRRISRSDESAALWEVPVFFVKTTYTPWERRLDTPIQ